VPRESLAGSDVLLHCHLLFGAALPGPPAPRYTDTVICSILNKYLPN
jgi:hypothetical protein